MNSYQPKMRLVVSLTAAFLLVAILCAGSALASRDSFNEESEDDIDGIGHEVERVSNRPTQNLAAKPVQNVVTKPVQAASTIISPSRGGASINFVNNNQQSNVDVKPKQEQNLASLFKSQANNALTKQATTIGSSGLNSVARAPSATARELIAKEESTSETDYDKTELDFFSYTGLVNWAKLLFNPFELVKAISGYFKIDLGALVEKIGGGLIWGVEACFSPLLAGIKIIEKVFVPDACRLKLMCSIGAKYAFMKDAVIKFSANFLETSSHIRAFSDGVIGRECSYEACTGEPSLLPDFAGLSTFFGGRSSHQSEHHSNHHSSSVLH